MRGRFGAARHGLRFAPSQSIKRDTTREIGNSSLLTVPQVDSYSSRFKCQPPRIASVPLFRKISKIQSGKSRNKLRCSSEYPPFSLWPAALEDFSFFWNAPRFFLLYGSEQQKITYETSNPTGVNFERVCIRS